MTINSVVPALLERPSKDLLSFAYLVDRGTDCVDEFNLHLRELVTQLPIHHGLFREKDKPHTKGSTYIWFYVEFLTLEIALFKEFIGDQFRGLEPFKSKST